MFSNSYKCRTPFNLFNLFFLEEKMVFVEKGTNLHEKKMPTISLPKNTGINRLNRLNIISSACKCMFLLVFFQMQNTHVLNYWVKLAQT